MARRGRREIDVALPLGIARPGLGTPAGRLTETVTGRTRRAAAERRAHETRMAADGTERDFDIDTALRGLVKPITPTRPVTRWVKVDGRWRRQ